LAKPKEVLSPADYKNYRNVRLVAVVFATQGSVLVLLVFAGVVAGIIGLATEKSLGPKEQFRPAAVIGSAAALGSITAFGLSGAVGGIATLRGSRRWAPVLYGMAAVHIIFFPIGTIMGYVILTGLSRYLGSVERIRGAARQDG
jgi:hypothetical protein